MIEYEELLFENKDELISFLKFSRNDLRQKKSDLEAKLAESDAYKLRIELAGAEKTIKVLKKQLAEKDKLIDEYIDSFEKVTIENANLAFKHSKDEIKFAIAELEKVKDFFCEEEPDGDGIPTGDWVYTKDAVEIAKYIDKLVNKLKGK